MDLREAIIVAKKEVKDHAGKAYLNAIPDAIEEFGSHGFNVQLLYASCNLSTWKGETAREAKKVIKAYLKEKKMF